jgi:hypothetical protein
MNHTSKIAAVAIVMALGLSQAIADEMPPKNAVPLSEIATSLEGQGYSPIVEMSIDKGVWEIEAYSTEGKRELKVNPLTGEILSDRPD